MRKKLFVVSPLVISAIIRKTMKGVLSLSRRGENFFKRKDGRWEGRYIKEVKNDGSKKYGSVYAKTYREVKEKQQLCIKQSFGSKRNVAVTVDNILQEC